MKEDLVKIICPAAAVLWILFVGPSVSTLCGISVRPEFWKMNRQQEPLTRFQFVLAFGVLNWGIGIFLLNSSDSILRVAVEKHLNAQLFDLGLSLALSLLLGIVIGLACARTQIGESPVTKLGI